MDMQCACICICVYVCIHVRVGNPAGVGFTRIPPHPCKHYTAHAFLHASDCLYFIKFLKPVAWLQMALGSFLALTDKVV